MPLSELVLSLLENDKAVCIDAIKSLLKITSKILNNPNEEKFRKLNLSSDLMEKKILPAIGALEILFLMGFEEGDDKLVLPMTSPLTKLTAYKTEIETLIAEKFGSEFYADASPQNVEKSFVITKRSNADMKMSEYKMKEELSHHFKMVLDYENLSLQEKARTVIPVQLLNKKAMERLSGVNKNIAENEKPMDCQDCLLIEVLAWFKDEFFSWFDKGWCSTCELAMKFKKCVHPMYDEAINGASRIEWYQCERCSSEERFPRYTHPVPLMNTKKGRCMEWASCFTFFCRALGFDARYVVDETDHVWTEVFSQSQDRWMHADSCENKFDIPLLYENGWNKKLSYIFAFSKDEIADCVWRYSADHRSVCSRRMRCREDWLASTIYAFNEEKQASYSPQKKKFLQLRSISEIVEFLTPSKRQREGQCEGRISGSIAWRLSRGETGEPAFIPHIFAVTDKEMTDKEMVVKYSAAQDFYVQSGKNDEIIKGWENGLFSFKDIFRKHEHDWKTVYLARNEKSEKGHMAWKFDCGHEQLRSVEVILQTKTFNDGKVCWQLCAGDICFPGNDSGLMNLTSCDFGKNVQYVEISIELSGGTGELAWQHAQLFRQGDKDKEYPFCVHLKFQ